MSQINLTDRKRTISHGPVGRGLMERSFLVLLNMSDRSQQRAVQVLVIEDNPGDVRLLEEAFHEVKSNVKLQVAHDGVEGLRMAQESAAPGSTWRPDLILLDLNLPKMNGHEVLLQLKASPHTATIPVIVLTSSRAETDVRLAYEEHANAYLRKPSSLDGLFTAARDITRFWMHTATLPRG